MKSRIQESAPQALHFLDDRRATASHAIQRVESAASAGGSTVRYVSVQCNVSLHGCYELFPKRLFICIMADWLLLEAPRAAP